jgi:hypothetical protein
MIELPDNLTRGDLYDLFAQLQRGYATEPPKTVLFRGLIGFVVNVSATESASAPEIHWELHLKVNGGGVERFRGSYSGLMPDPVPPPPPPRTRFERDDVV